MNRQADVVVVGGGCAGLVAALTASVAGAKVLLLEKTATLGGTLAWSGGAIWVPLNHHQLEAGIEDSASAVRRYMLAESDHRCPQLTEQHIELAPTLVTFLEQHTRLEFELGTVPDYHAEADGAVGSKRHQGFTETRSLGPRPINIDVLGDQEALLRRHPGGSVPLSFREFIGQVSPARVHELPWEEQLLPRMEAGWLGAGEALAAGLIAGLLDRGVEIQCESRVREFLQTNGTIEGVVVEHSIDGELQRQSITAERGVILCSGGFEWNEQLRKSFLAQPTLHPASPPANEGDGLLMAIAAGAALDNMSDNWGWVAYELPDAEVEGKPLVEECLVQRAQPHSIIVNQSGKRFANEAAPYTDLFRMLDARDSQNGRPNLPAYHIFDQQFRDQYSYGALSPAEANPEWMICASTVAELEQKLSLPAGSLSQTLGEFNRAVAAGVDAEFGRGSFAYDLVYADADFSGSKSAGPETLGTVERGPFYAVQLVPSTLGTKGGVVRSANSEVLDANGRVIPGLYAAGNVSASLSGEAYFGPGATLAEAMIFAYQAANSAAHN